MTVLSKEAAAAWADSLEFGTKHVLAAPGVYGRRQHEIQFCLRLFYWFEYDFATIARILRQRYQVTP